MMNKKNKINLILIICLLAMLFVYKEITEIKMLIQKSQTNNAYLDCYSDDFYFVDGKLVSDYCKIKYGK